MKIYMFRHQAGGFCAEWVFSSPPTKEQGAAVLTHMASRHGLKHPKTGEPYWLRVIEVEVYGPTSTIAPYEAPGDTVRLSGADILQVIASGVGRISNP